MTVESPGGSLHCSVFRRANTAAIGENNNLFVPRPSVAPKSCTSFIFGGKTKFSSSFLEAGAAEALSQLSTSTSPVKPSFSTIGTRAGTKDHDLESRYNAAAYRLPVIKPFEIGTSSFLTPASVAASTIGVTDAKVQPATMPTKPFVSTISTNAGNDVRGLNNTSTMGIFGLPDNKAAERVSTSLFGTQECVTASTFGIASVNPSVPTSSTNAGQDARGLNNTSTTGILGPPTNKAAERVSSSLFGTQESVTPSTFGINNSTLQPVTTPVKPSVTTFGTITGTKAHGLESRQDEFFFNLTRFGRSAIWLARIV